MQRGRLTRWRPFQSICQTEVDKRVFNVDWREEEEEEKEWERTAFRSDWRCGGIEGGKKGGHC